MASATPPEPPAPEDIDHWRTTDPHLAALAAAGTRFEDRGAERRDGNA